MSKRFVTAFIAIALIELGGLGAPAAEARSGRTALRMVPSGTAMVVAFNVDNLKGSTVFHKIVNHLVTTGALKPSMDIFRRGAGVDIKKNVSTLLIALAADFERSKKAVLFVEAKVDKKKLLAYVKKTDPKLKRLIYGGVSYYKLSHELELAFLNGYLVLAGKGYMRAILDTRANRTASLSQAPAFRAMVNTGSTRRDIWGVMRLPPRIVTLMAAQLGKHNIGTIMVSLDFPRGMDLHMRVATGSPRGATAIAKQLRAWFATAGSTSPMGLLGLGKALRTFQVKVARRRIDITGSFTAKQLGPIRSMLLNLL